MSQYLVRVKLFFDNNTKYEYYLVNDCQLEHTKKINKKILGGCCGTTECLACSFGSVHVVYDGHVQIDTNHLFIAKFVSQIHEYSLTRLFSSS